MSEIELLVQEEEEEERKLLSARELGQAVKNRLRELRWVQQDLAEELNTSQSVISGIIAGSYLLTFDLVTRLAKALKVSPLTLAGYYWKDEGQEIKENNDDLLEHIRQLLTQYYQIGGHQQLLDTPLAQPNTPMSSTDTDTVKEAIKENRKLKVKENPGPKDEGPGKRQINK